jgi:hypothetical protein
MKLQFDAKIEMDFAKVLAVRDKLVQLFGASDFIGGEMQFAENVPLSGLLNLNLNGLILESLSVESILSPGNEVLNQIGKIYQKLEPVVGQKHMFRAGFEFFAAIVPAKKREYLALTTVEGRKPSFSLLSYHPTHRKEIMNQLIDCVHLPATITESSENWFINPSPDSNISTSMTKSNGANPMAIEWQAPAAISERFADVEKIIASLANKEKSIKWSWEASTALLGSADELVAILNAADLTLPKGKLSFSYLLKDLEGLERMRMLLGAKAKLSAQAAVFRWPEDDRGQLWVDTKPNGYQIQLHLNDGDRIKELQEYLGIEFDSGRESFL